MKTSGHIPNCNSTNEDGEVLCPLVFVMAASPSWSDETVDNGMRLDQREGVNLPLHAMQLLAAQHGDLGLEYFQQS